MKKIYIQSMYLIMSLMPCLTPANPTLKNQKLNHRRQRRMRLTRDFLRIAQQYNPTLHSVDNYIEFVVKNRLKSHLLRTYFYKGLEEKAKGKTGLFIAVEDGCKAAQKGADITDYLLIIRRLLDQGADINTRDANLQTPLHIAAHYQNEEIIRLLRSYDANISLIDKNHNTPVDLAKNKATQDLILGHFEKDKLPKPNRQHTRARLAYEILMTLPHNNNIKLFHEEQESAALFIAVECGMLHHLLALLGSEEYKSTINNRSLTHQYHGEYAGITPLHLAVKNACIHAKKGNHEKYQTYKQIITVLLANGADINTQTYLKRTPLHCAAAAKNPEIVTLLLSYGADRLIEDCSNKTAYERCPDKKTASLIKEWADTTQQSLCTLKIQEHKLTEEFLHNIPRLHNLQPYKNKKNTEIHIATIIGAKEHLRRVMHQDNQPSLNTIINGETALIAGIKEYVYRKKSNDKAAARKRLDTLKLLLSQGANVNCADTNGNTPAHLAIQNNCPHLLRILLKYKPNLLKKNKKGKSPFALAEKLEEQTIYRELREFITEKSHTNHRHQHSSDESMVTPTAPMLETIQDEHTCAYTRNLYPLVDLEEESDQVNDTSYIQLNSLQNPFAPSIKTSFDQEMIPLNTLDNLPDTSELQPVYPKYSKIPSAKRKKRDDDTHYRLVNE